MKLDWGNILAAFLWILAICFPISIAGVLLLPFPASVIVAGVVSMSIGYQIAAIFPAFREEDVHHDRTQG